jgi:hypothetical protein
LLAKTEDNIKRVAGISKAKAKKAKLAIDITMAAS